MLSTTTGTPVTRPGGQLHVRMVVNHEEEKAFLFGDESAWLQHVLYLWFFVVRDPEERANTFTDKAIDAVHVHCDDLHVYVLDD